MEKQKSNKRKVVLIGTGMVGMSYAYAMLNSNNICDELVLIDLDKKRAMGEAMDLNHGIAFSGGNMDIYAGDYSDCSDADLITISAGVAQKPGESRIDLLDRNVEVFRSIIDPIMSYGFNGCFLISTNPVDIMSYVTQKLSGFDSKRVMGSGTTLDTARLRYLLGDYFDIDPRNVHAYVMGEHGDSEFVPWSQAHISTMPAIEMCNKVDCKCNLYDMEKIALDVKNAAKNIIEAKKATYYGIGMALVRITRAVLSDEYSLLTLSAMPNGEYGQSDVYTGLPCVVNRMGIDRIIELNLTEKELESLDNSCNIIRDICHKLKI